VIRIDSSGTRPERSGFLVVRAWLERSRQDGLRVRVIPMIEGVPRPVVSAGTVDDACAIVRHWLEELTNPP
jgi:hypothetical protein